MSLNSLFLTIFLASLLAAFLIRRYSKFHLKSEDLVGLQKFHNKPVPRIGGIAVYVSFFIGILLSNNVGDLFTIFLFGSGLFFSIGLIEDISRNISPRIRMISILISISIYLFISPIKYPGLNIELIDNTFFIYPFLVFLFNIWIFSSVINAFNIIDGFNGLAAGFAIFILFIVFFLSEAHNDSEVYELSLISIASILGFLVFNFPNGKIFLGDAGAYFIGFICAVLLTKFTINNSLSPWLALMLLIYPMYEMLFSIFRKIKNKSGVANPDSKHLHMLTYKKIILPKCKSSLVMCNSLNSVFILLLVIIFLVPTFLIYEEQKYIILNIFLFMISYSMFYKFLYKKNNY